MCLVYLVDFFLFWGSVEMAKSHVYLVSTPFQLLENVYAPAPALLSTLFTQHSSSHSESTAPPFSASLPQTVRPWNNLVSLPEETRKKEVSVWSKIWYPCGRKDGNLKGGKRMILTLAAGKQTAQPGWICRSNDHLMTWHSLACGLPPVWLWLLWEDWRCMWIWN